MIAVTAGWARGAAGALEEALEAAWGQHFSRRWCWKAAFQADGGGQGGSWGWRRGPGRGSMQRKEAGVGHSGSSCLLWRSLLSTEEPGPSVCRPGHVSSRGRQGQWTLQRNRVRHLYSGPSRRLRLIYVSHRSIAHYRNDVFSTSREIPHFQSIDVEFVIKSACLFP